MSLSPEQTARIAALAAEFAREGRTDDLMEFLDHGLQVDTVTETGDSLLMLAAYHGHLATIDALLDRGADVNQRNERDQSILAGALFKGEDEVVRRLVAAGADLDAGTPSARMAARMFGRALG